MTTTIGISFVLEIMFVFPTAHNLATPSPNDNVLRVRAEMRDAGRTDAERKRPATR